MRVSTDVFETTQWDAALGERRRATSRCVRTLISRDRDVTEYLSGAYAVLFGVFASPVDLRVIFTGASERALVFGATIAAAFRVMMILGGGTQLWAVWTKEHAWRRRLSLAAVTVWAGFGVGSLGACSGGRALGMLFVGLAVACAAAYVKLGRPEGGRRG